MNYDDGFSQEIEGIKHQIEELLEKRKKKGNPGKEKIDAQIVKLYDDMKKKLRKKSVLF